MGRPKGSKNRPKSPPPEAATIKPVPEPIPEPMPEVNVAKTKRVYVRGKVSEITKWLSEHNFEYSLEDSDDPEFSRVVVLDSLCATMISVLFRELGIRVADSLPPVKDTH